jgi:hypothetical protein
MNNTKAYFEMQHEETGSVARWHGGAYIELGYIQSQGVDGIHGDDFHAIDVINVWDYETDQPRIPRTLDAFRERVMQAWDEAAADDLR